MGGRRVRECEETSLRDEEIAVYGTETRMEEKRGMGRWSRRAAPYARKGRRGGGKQGGGIEINESKQQRIVGGTPYYNHLQIETKKERN